MDPVNTGNVDVNDLFNEAHEEGGVSEAAMQSLQIMDLNAAIRPGLGRNIDDIITSEMVLVILLIDDSGSIRFSSNSQLVRNGHNQIVNDVLQASRGAENVMISCRYLNPSIAGDDGNPTDVLYPFCPVDQATEMDSHNYNPDGGTPLYDQMVVTLGTVQAETQRWTRLNVPCRSITVVITDGADQGSREYGPSDVRSVVRSMLAQENNIVCAMGIEDEYGTDFHQVFSELGVPDDWVLTPGNTDSEIRRAFNMVSQSVSRASQAATGMTSDEIRDSFEWD